MLPFIYASTTQTILWPVEQPTPLGPDVPFGTGYRWLLAPLSEPGKSVSLLHTQPGSPCCQEASGLPGEAYTPTSGHTASS